jgi:hypothetical protein
MSKERGVDEIKEGKVVRSFLSIRSAAKELGIDHRSISSVLSGRYRQTAGYKFKYTDTSIVDEVWVDHHIGVKVSNLGRIQYPTGKQSFGTKSFHGYMYCHYKGKKHRIHRLVLESFVEAAPLGMECDHIDRIKTNNKLENLRWVTSKENQNNRSNNLRLSDH